MLFAQTFYIFFPPSVILSFPLTLLGGINLLSISLFLSCLISVSILLIILAVSLNLGFNEREKNMSVS